MIPFNIPYISGEEEDFIHEAIQRNDLAGDGFYTKKCQQQLEKHTKASRVLLTSSCTHALELAALLCNIQPGDEVIMPSFTFVSSANAFVLRGAKIVFVDIRPDTMNINEKLIEPAITDRTKAILVMHYAGVACEMNAIMQLAEKHDLFVIEDAAQCMDAFYEQKHLGTIGHLGTFSFHATKNIHCGEGGALLINDKKMINRAEIIREKGTNRKAFMRGEVDKYSWVDIGSSYLMSELNAAFLYAQLGKLAQVKTKRRQIIKTYQSGLETLSDKPIPYFKSPEHCDANGHIFFIKCEDFEARSEMILHLKKEGIQTAFHYVPLHSSAYGKRIGRFAGQDVHTTRESNRILRLPVYYDLEPQAATHIIERILSFQKQLS